MRTSTMEGLVQQLEELSETLSLTKATGNPLYDDTYATLCEAAREVRAASDTSRAPEALMTLVLGLAAWNPQAGRIWSDRPPLLSTACGESSAEVMELLTMVRLYEDRRIDDPPVKEATQVLGVTETRIATASKLLHFLSPANLPILDKNVATTFQRTPTRNLYWCYAHALDNLGVTARATTPLAVWIEDIQHQEPEIRLRAIDCALWREGKRLAGTASPRSVTRT